MRRFIKRREFYISVITLVLWLLVSIANPNFASPKFLVELIGFNSVYFICALGILPLMIKGEFDLSIGAMISATSVILSLLTQIFNMGPLSILVGALLGMGLGLFSGLIIAKFKVPSIIVTLAMMNVYYGFSKYLYRAFGDKNTLQTEGEALNFGYQNWLIIGMLVLVFIFLHYTKAGRGVYAFGNDRSLAIKKGFIEPQITLLVHGISGLGAGLVAAIYHMTYTGVTIESNLGIEFELIIIVIIGGVSILGGTGTVYGTFFSGLFLVVLRTGLVFARIPVFWHDMIIGLIIIGVVSYDMFRHRLRLNRLFMMGD